MKTYKVLIQFKEQFNTGFSDKSYFFQTTIPDITRDDVVIVRTRFGLQHGRLNKYWTDKDSSQMFNNRMMRSIAESKNIRDFSAVVFVVKNEWLTQEEKKIEILNNLEKRQKLTLNIPSI